MTASNWDNIKGIVLRDSGYLYYYNGQIQSTERDQVTVLNNFMNVFMVKLIISQSWAWFWAVFFQFLASPKHSSVHFCDCYLVYMSKKLINIQLWVTKFLAKRYQLDLTCNQREKRGKHSFAGENTRYNDRPYRNSWECWRVSQIQYGGSLGSLTEEPVGATLYF